MFQTETGRAKIRGKCEWKNYYIFNKEHEVVFAVKDGFNNEDFAVMLRNDSIALGNEFEAWINMPKDDFKVTINQPDHYAYTRADVKTNYEYKLKTTKAGTFNFAGVIEYDTIKASFEYKFFVKDL